MTSTLPELNADIADLENLLKISKSDKNRAFILTRLSDLQTQRNRMEEQEKKTKTEKKSGKEGEKS